MRQYYFYQCQGFFKGFLKEYIIAQTLIYQIHCIHVYLLFSPISDTVCCLNRKVSNLEVALCVSKRVTNNNNNLIYIYITHSQTL